MAGSITQDDVLKGDIIIGAIGGLESRQANDHEHSLGFIEAVKMYPTAIGWSIFFSLGKEPIQHSVVCTYVRM